MMKRIIYCLFVTLIFISLMAACQNIGNSEAGGNDDGTLGLGCELPVDFTVYSFESYADLFDALVNVDSERYEEMQSEEEQYGELYCATRAAFLSKTIEVLIPAIDGIEMELRNEEGFSNIALMTKEVYYLPWIWYHCLYNGEDVRIEISCPCVMDEDLKKENSIIDILNIMAPDAPMPSNFLSDPHRFEDYKNIYTKDITLSDSNTVLALVRELKDTEEIYVSFAFDGVLVLLYAENDILLSEDFWQKFSVREYGVSQNHQKR